MGIIHTAAILSRETEKALSYHSRPCNEKLESEAIDGFIHSFFKEKVLGTRLGFINEATLVSRGKSPLCDKGILH